MNRLVAMDCHQAMDRLVTVDRLVAVDRLVTVDRLVAVDRLDKEGLLAAVLRVVAQEEVKEIGTKVIDFLVQMLVVQRGMRNSWLTGPLRLILR